MLKRHEEQKGLDGDARRVVEAELAALNVRAQVNNAAVTAGASCAILVCILIGSRMLALSS